MLGLVISHPDDSASDNPDPLLFTPSAAEMRAQMALAVPFAVVVCTGSAAYVPWWFGDQRPTPGLIGRPFRHGVTDCYSFVRDWYRLEYGLRIPDFPRDWEWWKKGQDLYGQGFHRAGGRCIDPADARPGDVVLCRIRSRVPNHAVVLMPDGWVGHHFGSTAPYDPSAQSRVQRADGGFASWGPTRLDGTNMSASRLREDTGRRLPPAAGSGPAPAKALGIRPARRQRHALFLGVARVGADCHHGHPAARVIRLHPRLDFAV